VTPKIVVVHSRKGGVGKTTTAYELAHLLNAVLVDLEWEDGGASRAWGYRHEDRLGAVVPDALAANRVPRPLKGYGKPHLVPGHPTLEQNGTEAKVFADALKSWADAWGSELGIDWVVVDTHPGSNPLSDGANSVADVVLAPLPLRTKDLEAAASMVNEMADFPLVIVPNMVDNPDPIAVRRLTSMVEGTPVRVGPFVPFAKAVGNRRKRLAITSEDKPARPLRPVAAAFRSIADYVRSYVET
jgi:chromosome partitioning protein